MKIKDSYYNLLFLNQKNFASSEMNNESNSDTYFQLKVKFAHVWCNTDDDVIVNIVATEFILQIIQQDT